MAAASRRAAEPGLVAADPSVDLRLATLAATVALRRHARGSGVGAPRRGGHDLSRVRLAVGSGGVLRYAPPERARAVLTAAVTDQAGGWKLPTAARTSVDRAYVLAAAGLLAAEYPDAAVALLAGQFDGA